MPKNQQSTGIHIENSSNVKVHGNVTVGMGKGIVAKNVQDLHLEDNLCIESSCKPEGQYLKNKNIPKLVGGIIVTILSGLAVAYLTFRFGWK